MDPSRAGRASTDRRTSTGGGRTVSARIGPIQAGVQAGASASRTPGAESKVEPSAFKPAAALAKLGGAPWAPNASKLREKGATNVHQSARSAHGAEPKGLASQVERGLAAALRQGGGSVTIRLAPEALGSLRIRMVFEEGKVSASFEPTDEAAQKLLTEELPALRRALESRGLAVERLDVDAPAAREALRESGHPRQEAGHERSASGGAGEGGHGGHGRGDEPPWGGGAAPDRRAWEQASPEDPAAKAARGVTTPPTEAPPGSREGATSVAAVIDALA